MWEYNLDIREIAFSTITVSFPITLLVIRLTFYITVNSNIIFKK